MHKEVIKIGYPGNCISVNHYLGRRKGGGYYMKPEAKAWAEEFMWLLKRLHLEDWELPLQITCSGYFKNWKEAVDLSNLSKVILDTIEELTGINDSNFRWRDGERLLVKGEPPFLLIAISDALQSKSNGIKEESNGNG